MPLYLTPKLKVMETPNLVRERVHQDFLEKLVMSLRYYHSDVTPIFSKNDIIFAITSQAV